MSIPNEFFTELDQRENDERESDIAAGFSEALKTGGEVTTPGGRTIRVVEPPTSVRVTLSLDWKTVVQMAGLEPDSWYDVATVEEVNHAARKELPGVLEAGLTSVMKARRATS